MVHEEESYPVPPDRSRIGQEPFHFHCHPGVSCYLSCCHNVDLLLFPYDIILLKNQLRISSSEFLRRHAEVCEGSHPYFPGLRLKMAEQEGAPCPFLSDQGCTVYRNRPSACRTYPLERGVERPAPGAPLVAHYFMTHHPYCLGHGEQRAYTLRQWERDQALYDCNMYNDIWAETDAFFATNPWAGEGKAGPRQQLAFLTCYDIDGFRAYVSRHGILDGFALNKDERRGVLSDDGRLLRFGLAWIEQILGGRARLAGKQKGKRGIFFA